MYRTYRVEQPRQDVGHVAAQEAVFPQQLLLLLRDLGQGVPLLNISEQGYFCAGGLHLRIVTGIDQELLYITYLLRILRIESDKKFCIFLNLFTIRKYNRMSS